MPYDRLPVSIILLASSAVFFWAAHRLQTRKGPAEMRRDDDDDYKTLRAAFEREGANLERKSAARARRRILICAAITAATFLGIAWLYGWS